MEETARNRRAGLQRAHAERKGDQLQPTRITGGGRRQDLRQSPGASTETGYGHREWRKAPRVRGQRLSLSPARDPSHDILAALEEWTEAGIAPERLIATRYSEGNPHPTVCAQRPIYPYPQFPKFILGDPTRADSFGPTFHQRSVGLGSRASGVPRDGVSTAK